MKTRLSLLTVVALAVIHCGPPGPDRVEIAVTDSADALTTAGNDNLFSVTLSKAARSYALSEISVNAGLPGQTQTVVNFTLEDGNGNGKLDPGEKLNCKEPPVNLFDANTVGKAVTVSFTDQDQGTYFQVGSGTWTPAN